MWLMPDPCSGAETSKNTDDIDHGSMAILPVGNEHLGSVTPILYEERRSRDSSGITSGRPKELLQPCLQDLVKEFPMKILISVKKRAKKEQADLVPLMTGTIWGLARRSKPLVFLHT
ncbi:hypothetical protein Tco_1116914 [Tanacetum coccineum]